MSTEPEGPDFAGLPALGHKAVNFSATKSTPPSTQRREGAMLKLALDAARNAVSRALAKP